MNQDSASIPPRLDPGRVLDKDTHTMSLSAPDRTTISLHGNMQQQPDKTPRSGGRETRPSSGEDATSMRVDQQSNISSGRDLLGLEHGGDCNPSSSIPSDTMTGHNTHTTQSSQRQSLLPSSNNSQVTSSTNDTDLAFTPPASEGGMSPNKGSVGNSNSSQESQLLRLSQIAAAQERIPDNSMETEENGAASRKRMADGVVKHTRNQSSTSPVRMGGHSRNTSTVSVASTTGSRIGEISASLKAHLSYAMVKVNNGWQGHSIDQIEALASQGGSPTSSNSNSTIHLRNGSSASPQLSHRGSNNTTPATGPQHQFPGRFIDPVWRRSPQSGSGGSPTSPVKGSHSLAPPVSIQPSRHFNNPRRNSNPRHTPTFLTGSNHASPIAGPHTPGQPSPYLGTAHHRTPMVDQILFSPHQNVREQDAIESLLFMSSPGNSANLKHNFPSSSQPVPSGLGSQRTALPSSQPRKSLPTSRPPHVRSQSHTQKRVGFEKSPYEMDIDDPSGSPHARATPRRKLNGNVMGHGHNDVHSMVPRLKQLPVSMGLTVPTRPRKVLGEEEIDRMLDRVVAADDGSDSEGEIQIPVSRVRRDGAQVVGA